MVLDAATAAQQVLQATSAEAILGPPGAERKRRERDLARILHPDAGGDGKAFARLQELLAIEARKASGEFDVTTKNRTYAATGLFARGRVANLYAVRFVRNGAPEHGLLKLPRSPKDNDLMQADASALRRITDSGKKRAGFYPQFVEGFRHRDTDTRVDRRAFVMERLDGFYTLEQVRSAYPKGVDARDLAWMWRRCLSGISLAHELGIVHGGLTPENVIIHPQEHGVILADLTASTEIGGRIKLLHGRPDFYPPEVIKKEPVTESTDLFVLHRTMEWMLHPDSPRQFFAFIKGVCQPRVRARPHDAKQLLGEYEDLLERTYGKRKFRVFNMPTKENQ